MNPFPANNSLIIMDNAKIHRNPRVRQMIEARCVPSAGFTPQTDEWIRGCRLLYLPAYSPDYNPIELAFSKIKAFVRRNGGVARVDKDMDDTDVIVYLLRVTFSVTAEDANGWFHHCGYI